MGGRTAYWNGSIMNGWAEVAGIALLFIGFGVLLWAPYEMQPYGIMAWVFSVMLIHASGYGKKEKKR